MKLTNLQIYTYAQDLNSAFTDKNQHLPALIGFCIQKNAQTLLALAQEVEEQRMTILRYYAEADEAGNLIVPDEKISQANEELQGLLDIEQEVNILKINIHKIADLDFSMEQINAIMFMVEGE